MITSDRSDEGDEGDRGDEGYEGYEGDRGDEGYEVIYRPATCKPTTKTTTTTMTTSDQVPTKLLKTQYQKSGLNISEWSHFPADQISPDLHIHKWMGYIR